MAWSILLLPLNQGGIVTTSCTLVFTALLHYYAIPFFAKYYWSSMPEKKATGPKLNRQMTSIGKFALLSQTERNPSIISFFIALASKDEGMSIDEFHQMWSKIMTKHERFRFHVREADKCFEDANKSLDEYTLELPHPKNPDEFKARINKFLTSPINVTDQPWEVGISSGPIGTSGAIMNSEELIAQGYKSETVALFRVHHVLCDGVSCATVIKDASDECDLLDNMMLEAVDKYKMHMKKMGMLKKCLGYIMYYFFGSIYALAQQFWKMLTSTNPFDEFTTKDSKANANGRSVSWNYLAEIDEAKTVAKSISKHAKLNDLFVSLLSSALERQYTELKAKSAESSSKCPSSVNIVIPVHLTGSILPGQGLGNNIGAFVSSVPFNVSPQKKLTSSLRMHKVHQTLSRAKRTPAPLISWFVTSLISKLGIEAIAKDAIVRANCHAVAVVSNVQAFPFQIHWNQRAVKMMCPLLPLPPKVPIGVGVTSYDGKIILSVESADERVVPNADQFLNYILEEYESLKREISSGDRASLY